MSVSACAWTWDGKWIATGDVVGDIFLWNAPALAGCSTTSRVTFAMQLPRNQPNTSRPTTSLVFVPDSTALIFISGGYLSVWDIDNVEFVANSGLPDKARNIALDVTRNRLAVAVDDRITIYMSSNWLRRCVRWTENLPFLPNLQNLTSPMRW